jgi:hypothetical protein
MALIVIVAMIGVVMPVYRSKQACIVSRPIRIKSNRSTKI